MEHREFKGTKGPWVRAEGLTHWIRGKDGYGDVCKISRHCKDDGGDEQLCKSDQANLDLIESAPQMLEVLKNARDMLGMAALLDKSGQCAAQVEECDLILAKALGLKVYR